ncbi:hypothetical protein BDW72DRAFT_108341 [Aspergillus terricola var. indicus]
MQGRRSGPSLHVQLQLAPADHAAVARQPAKRLSLASPRVPKFQSRGCEPSTELPIIGR